MAAAEKRPLADLAAGALVAAASLFFAIRLWLNPAGGAVFGVSSGTLPMAMALLLLGLSLALAAVSRAAMRSAPRRRVEAPEGRARLAALALVCLAFVAALPWAGFLLSGALLVGASAWLFGGRRPVRALAMMALAPFALAYFFETAMVIYLPAGRLFQ